MPLPSKRVMQTARLSKVERLLWCVSMRVWRLAAPVGVPSAPELSRSQRFPNYFSDRAGMGNPFATRRNGGKRCNVDLNTALG